VKQREPQTCLGAQISHGVAICRRYFELHTRFFGEILCEELQQPIVNRVATNAFEMVRRRR
jgi:hypothetical protein